MKKNIISGLILMLILSCGVMSFARQLPLLASEDRTSAAKDFVKLLVRGDYSGAERNFDYTVAEALPVEKLEQTWTSLIGQVGSFKRQAGTRKEKIQQYDVVFVTCEFANSTLDVKVVFNSTGQISGLFFVPSQTPTAYEPPAYVKSKSFREKEIKVGKGEWSLPGTLTLPAGKGPFPVVVLVHGSGPNDRDETIGPNKPFRDLAFGLASQGIAVLRYEKRTRFFASKLRPIMESITVKEETVDDALAAVTLLRKTTEINPHRIFLLGHSLGGMLVPKIGTLDSTIAGFIIMAGTTRSLEDVILEQTTYIYSLDTTNSERQRTQLALLKRQVELVKDPMLSPVTPSIDLPLNIPAKYWLDLRGYHPAEVVKNLKRPILILQGERDYQVTMKDFQIWKESLFRDQRVEFRTYPDLNHLFFEGEGKSTPAEYQSAGHVARAVIDDIARWIKQR
jgi:dienelactone hydrolase